VVGQKRLYLWPDGGEPVVKGRESWVPKAQMNDAGRWIGEDDARGKIRILCYDHPIVLPGVLPEFAVAGVGLESVA